MDQTLEPPLNPHVAITNIVIGSGDDDGADLDCEERDEHAEPFQHDGNNDAGDDLPPEGTYDAETIKANSGLDQNDTDNAKRLLRLFGDNLLNVRLIGQHFWEGRFWKWEGGDEYLQRCAQDTAKLIKLEAQYLTPPPGAQALIDRAKELAAQDSESLSATEKAELKAGNEAALKLQKRKNGRYNFGISCGNRSRTVGMIGQALPHFTIAPEELDADPMKFNVANGTLIFERAEVQEEDPWEEPRFRTVIVVKHRFAPHDRRDLISKMSGMAYDPEAKAPRWLAFLERFQPDAAQRRFLQTACGRVLIGGACTQALIFLYGDGANGKSVFMETLAQAYGDYAGRLKPEAIAGTKEQGGENASPDFARLPGKRFVAIAELPRGVPLREGLVKTMTGSEPMMVRHLHSRFFDMIPQFIPFMSGNQMPEIGGLDNGIWRRLKFVHWPVTISEGEQRPAPEVVAEFMAEASGILNWLIEGAILFLQEGLHDPPSVQELTQGHRGDLDPVGAFVTACVIPDAGGWVQAREIYNHFKHWCEANSIRPWSEKNFSLALKKKGFLKDTTQKVYRWMDIKVDVDGLPPRHDPQPDSYERAKGY